MKASLEKKLAPTICGRCPIFEESGRPLPVEHRKPSVSFSINDFSLQRKRVVWEEF